MADIKPSIVLEDSKGNRYFFYYKDSSIYYKELSCAGESKDTMLINQASADFAAAIDTNDAVYLICNSRYKGILLFIYTNLGWKFEPVVNLHNSSNIYIMDILAQNGSIHIFFSKKLPIANMYNVYHLHKDINEQVSYIEYSWRKNSLSEIYSQNIENSYSVISSKGGIIHYASVWYDGARYYINYYCYDDSTKSWIHKSLNISYKNQVFIKLINHNKKISLICFSNENEASNVHHFLNKSSGSSEIDFKELNNAYIDTGGVVPLFYADDKAIQFAWIKDHVLHQYTSEDSSGKWRKAVDLPLTSETNIQVLKIIKNAGSVSGRKGYFLLDKNFNITRPVEHAPKNTTEDKPKEKPKAEVFPEINDYLKQILDELKGLSDNFILLNNRIDNLESKTFVQEIHKDEQKELLHAEQKTAINNSNEQPKLKKSNFKERFMKSEKTPNYDSLLVKQENINTYVGKPGINTIISEASPASKADSETADNEKQAFAAPPSISQKYTADENSEAEEIPHEYVNLLKKIGEFFK